MSKKLTAKESAQTDLVFVVAPMNAAPKSAKKKSAKKKSAKKKSAKKKVVDVSVRSVKPLPGLAAQDGNGKKLMRFRVEFSTGGKWDTWAYDEKDARKEAENALRDALRDKGKLRGGSAAKKPAAKKKPAKKKTAKKKTAKKKPAKKKPAKKAWVSVPCTVAGRALSGCRSPSKPGNSSKAKRSLTDQRRAAGWKV